MNEQPVVFQSQDHWLAGIVHHGEQIRTAGVRRGVIIIVGGPQTRVGSHRQFVLLARYLARHGISVFRFDYAGIGDSEGELSDFLAAPPDIGPAIEQFMASCPGLESIALWGLCDGASAILLYLSQRQAAIVNCIIVANPWVEQRQSKAKTLLKHYYLERLFCAGLWRKIIGGKFEFGAAVTGVSRAIINIFRRDGATIKLTGQAGRPKFNQDNFVYYMKQGLANFNGHGHLILSGQDLVAREFCQLLADDPEWRQLISQKFGSQLDLELSNHTFANATWRCAVEKFTVDKLVN